MKEYKNSKGELHRTNGRYNMLRVIIKGLGLTNYCYTGFEKDKILRSHKWNNLPGNVYYECKCEAYLYLQGKDSTIASSYRNLICPYDKDDHMVIDIIC